MRGPERSRLVENGVPAKPDFKRCGINIKDWSYMVDEFPEQEPGETVQLECMPGKPAVLESQIDMSGAHEELVWGDVRSNMENEHGVLFLPGAWVKTQQELRREYKRKMSTQDVDGSAEQRIEKKPSRIRRQMSEKKIKKRLMRRKKKEALREFRREAQVRQDEGHTAQELLRSHMPDIGRKVTVSQAEVKQYIQNKVFRDLDIIYIQVYIYIDINTYSYTYTYIYIDIHTYIYTCTLS